MGAHVAPGRIVVMRAEADRPAGASAENQLVSSGLPIFFELHNIGELDLELPVDRHGQTVRVWARSLNVMQKEAIVVSERTGRAWRLASDEGPYLNGFDSAPCPLAFLTTGMVASYMNEIVALGRQRAIRVHELVLVQDNFYTMEGSALQGTMIGGALPVELSVHIRADADENTLRGLLLSAVDASPINGLMRGQHRSLFTLTLNGEVIPAGVRVVGRTAPQDPGDRFSMIRAAKTEAEPLVQRTRVVEAVHGVAGGAGTSLQADQKRRLHLRGTCRLREDGVKEITQELFSPRGSTFRFLSDETPEFGGHGRAPDAATYMSAGIAFCFMTQLGRYATITKKNLVHYNVIQDAYFSPGGGSGGTGRPGVADPIETYVYLTSSEGDIFARQCLEMGEQTCFLHAFCRTDLETKISVKPPIGQDS